MKEENASSSKWKHIMFCSVGSLHLETRILILTLMQIVCDLGQTIEELYLFLTLNKYLADRLVPCTRSTFFGETPEGKSHCLWPSSSWLQNVLQPADRYQPCSLAPVLQSKRVMKASWWEEKREGRSAASESYTLFLELHLLEINK